MKLVEMLKNIADWYKDLTSAKKLSVINVFVIGGLIYIIFHNLKVSEDAERNYRENLNRYEVAITTFRVRCDSVNAAYAQKVEDCRDLRIEEVKETTEYFRQKLEELNKKLMTTEYRTNQLLKKVEE